MKNEGSGFQLMALGYAADGLYLDRGHRGRRHP
jgi:hypothetical protein